MTLFLSFDQVVKLHDRLVNDHGGLRGIRDEGLLISALETPRAKMFGQDLYPTIYDKGAAYLFHIVQNRPFLDGNRRTGAF
jgi:death-on-curing protein